MKIAISLPDTLFDAADRLAARLGISRSQLFQQALQLMIEKQDSAGVAAALNKVYGRPGRDHELDKTLARMQSASLPREDW